MREQWLKDMVRDGEVKVPPVKPEPKPHTVRGEVIGPEGRPYGTTHDYNCPGCEGTSFLASPRSETYWSS